MEVDEKGHLATPTPASILIEEFHSRKVFSGLGYKMEKIETLDDFTAVSFLKISNEYIKAENKKLKPKKKPRGKK